MLVRQFSYENNYISLISSLLALLFENNALDDIVEGLVDESKSGERDDSSENKQKILEANELISTSSEDSNQKQKIIFSDYTNTEQQNIRGSSDEQLNEFFSDE